MLKIKLMRLGKKSEPRYRIVVNEARDKSSGSYVAKLGYYHPTKNPKELVLDVKAYDEWLQKGAQPTETVAFLYDVVKTGKGFPEGKPKLSKKAKAKLASEKEAAQAAAEAAKVEKETPEVATETAPEAPTSDEKKVEETVVE